MTGRIVIVATLVLLVGFSAAAQEK